MNIYLQWVFFSIFSRLFLLQGVFQTQELNPCLLHCRRILYQLSHKGSPRILVWVTYPFSSGSSRARNWTGVSCIAGECFTNWAVKEARLKLKSFFFSLWTRRETLTFGLELYIDSLGPSTCWLTLQILELARLHNRMNLPFRIPTNRGKFLKRWEFQTTLSASWEICMHVS